MLRSELLNTLKRIAPALADAPTMPVFDHFCLDGKTAVAYDGIVALRTPYGIGVKGALSGGKLLSILASSRAEEVTCAAVKDAVTFNLGRTKLKMSLLPPGDFIFKAPDMDGQKLALDESLRNGIELATRAMTPDSVMPGVTVIFGKKELTLYSTNNVSLFRASVPCKSSGFAGKTYTLSGRFCELLLKLGGDAEIVFTDSGDVLGLAEGVELFGRVLEEVKTERFDKVFRGMDSESIAKANVPASLIGCLQRAVVVSADPIKFSYADGRLGLFAESQDCQVRDSVKIDLGKDVVEVYTGAGHLMRYLDAAKRIGVSEKCIVLDGVGFQVLIAVRSAGEDR